MKPRFRIPTAVLLLAILWLPGFWVAINKVFLRISAENQKVFVETVVDFEELRSLSRQENWQLSDMLQSAAEAGASSVAISEDTLRSLESEGRLSILTFQEIQKLSLEDGVASLPPDIPSALGALWVFSKEDALLDRIYQNLVWKLKPDQMRRIHRNMLLINKSGDAFKERVGLGFSRDFLQLAAENNLGIVLRVFNYPGLRKESINWIIDNLPEPASVSVLLFANDEVLGSRGDIEAVIEKLRERSYRIGLIEFHEQLGLDRLVSGLRAERPFVRVHSITRREIDDVYDLERSVSRWVRAVRERSIGVLYIRCFFQDKNRFIEDLVSYNLDYFAMIKDQLAAYGYRIARTGPERMHEPRHITGRLSWAEMLAMGLSLLLGATVTFSAALKRQFGVSSVILTAGFCAAWALLFSESSFILVTGLVGAVSYGLMGTFAAINHACEKLSKADSPSIPVIFAGFIGILALPAIFCGVLLAGLHSEPLYLLKYAQFRGVKLALSLPLLITFIWSAKAFGGSLFSLLSKPITIKSAVLILAATAGVTLAIARSGNWTLLRPSATEDWARSLLEKALVARPRNKEFLIGYPAAVLLFFLLRRRKSQAVPVLSVFVTMGQVSTINTFCHFHSPFLLSMLRSVNGLVLGTIIGVGFLWAFVIAGIMLSLFEKRSKPLLIGYFGFGNAGDEILWQSFVKESLAKRPELQFNILWPQESPVVEKGVFPVRRHVCSELLEAVAGTRTIIVPGGGVLQAATSYRSLLYYSFLILLGKACAAKILMPGQGLGPWNPRSSLSLIPGFVARFIGGRALSAADYISVRDTASISAFRELCGRTKTPPALTADAAFLAEPTPTKATSPRSDEIRIGVILRGCDLGSFPAADLFTRFEEEMENLKLLPIALQPVEDEKPWKGRVPVKIENAAQLLSTLAGLDILFSMRLHGCIFATIAGIPWMGISYDPKVSAFAEEISWDYIVNSAELDEKKLSETIEHIMKKAGTLKRKLRQASTRLRAAAAKDIDACLEHLSKPEKVHWDNPFGN